MKYKTLRTSETGQKLEALVLRIADARTETIKLINELGAKQWRNGYWCINSGVSALIFPEGFEIPKYYKEVEGGYLPKLNSKLGKEIDEKLKALPKIKPEELNNCVGLEHWPGHIGYDLSNNDYFLFTVSEKWNYKPSTDCIEITTNEYNELINKTNN